MNVDEEALLGVAVEAARRAGEELATRFGQVVHGRAKSGPTDLVSDADLAAEAAIRSVLRVRRPGDAILAEEGGVTAGGALRWVVDPLDGTTNFLFGIPAFAVSIACEDGSGGVAGAVLDPSRGEIFTATRSGPALLNGSPVAPRSPGGSLGGSLGEALVATGFAYDAGVRARQASILGRVLPRVRDIRRGGSAALDLCWTACGRYDAYFETGLQPWDVAAGSLIAARAGLVVRRIEAVGEMPWGVLVTREELIDELEELVAR
jgi:myo-inositol-1(or 4)-monophosphatase